MNSKLTTNSKLSTIEPKKQKLRKQVEQEQNHRNRDPMEGYQWGGGEGEWEKDTGIRSIIGRHKIHTGRLRIV